MDWSESQAESSPGDPDVAQHSVFRVERPRHVSVVVREGAGGLASGSDLWWLRLEFMGIVISCLQRNNRLWLAEPVARFSPSVRPSILGWGSGRALAVQVPPLLRKDSRGQAEQRGKHSDQEQ